MRYDTRVVTAIGLGLMLMQVGPVRADEVLLDPKTAQIVVSVPGGKSVLAALGEETPLGSGYFKVVYPPMPPTGAGNPCMGAVLSPLKAQLFKHKQAPLPAADAPVSAAEKARSMQSGQYVSAGECLLKALSADHPPPQLTGSTLQRFRVVQAASGNSSALGSSLGSSLGANPAVAGASQVSDAAWTESYQIAYFRPEVVSTGASATVSAGATAAPQASAGALVSAGTAASSLAVGTAVSVAITAGLAAAVIGTVVASEGSGEGTTVTVSTTATTR